MPSTRAAACNPSLRAEQRPSSECGLHLCAPAWVASQLDAFPLFRIRGARSGSTLFKIPVLGKQRASMMLLKLHELVL